MRGEHSFTDYYYFNTTPDLIDFIAVALSFLSILVIMLMVWQAVLLLRRPPRQKRWAIMCGLIIFFGAGYTLLYAFDVPTILSTITTKGGDVPLLSTLRGAFIIGLLFTLTRVLSGASRLEAKDEKP